MTKWRSELQRLEGAYSPSTLRCYLSDIAGFEAWCQARQLSAFPADVSMLCDFITERGQSQATSTIRRSICAIRKIHRLLDLEDPTAHEDVNLAFRKVRRGKFNRQKQAKGLTRSYLEQFLAVQPDSLLGLRNRAMLSLGYDLLTRRSELVALQTDDICQRGDGTLQVIIRRGKSDPYGHGRIAFSSRRSAELINEWLQQRNMDIAPLFCPVYSGKPIDRGLSTTAVKRLIKQSAISCGLSSAEVVAFSGHSMRVGAAQDLLTAGYDSAAIMRAGGWKSVNVLARYLEHAESNVWT